MFLHVKNRKGPGLVGPYKSTPGSSHINYNEQYQTGCVGMGLFFIKSGPVKLWLKGTRNKLQVKIEIATSNTKSVLVFVFFAFVSWLY